MKTSTIITIETILEADRSVSKAKRDQIMDVIFDRSPRPKRRLGTKKQAAEALGCCTKTIDRYVEKGLLKRMEYSKRQHRFDLNEVERLGESE